MNTSLHDDDFSSTTYLMTAGESLAASYRYDAFGNLAGASSSLALAQPLPPTTMPDLNHQPDLPGSLTGQ